MRRNGYPVVLGCVYGDDVLELHSLVEDYVTFAVMVAVGADVARECPALGVELHREIAVL